MFENAKTRKDVKLIKSGWPSTANHQSVCLRRKTFLWPWPLQSWLTKPLQSVASVW